MSHCKFYLAQARKLCNKLIHLLVKQLYSFDKCLLLNCKDLPPKLVQLLEDHMNVDMLLTQY